MLALIVSLMMTAPMHPSVLNVPSTPNVEIDQKEIWIDALAQCESHGSTTVKAWDVNSRWSVGKYQYQYQTWLMYSKRFGTTRENITDGELQDKVTRYILDTKGWGDWYNCGRGVVQRLGSYPQ